MPHTIDVAVLVGSLRRDSLTRRLALALSSLCPASMKLELVPLDSLTMYNQDEEVSQPAAWRSFRDRIRRADAVLFVTPEYNRSVPGVLKNAVDIGSRPHGESVWEGKPAAVISASPGTMGAFGANHHLRQSLVFLNMPTLQQPEAYIGGIDKLLDANNQIIVEATKDYCGRILSAFERWILRNGR